MPFDFASLADYLTPEDFRVKKPKNRKGNIVLEPEAKATDPVKVQIPRKIDLGESKLSKEPKAPGMESLYYPAGKAINTITAPIGKALEFGMTSASPKAEEDVKKFLSKGGYIGDLIGDSVGLEGSTSILGALTNAPEVGALIKGGLVGAKVAASMGGKGLIAKGAASLAGMPFFKLGKKLGLPEIQGKPVVLRGDAGGHEFLDPRHYDKSDTLGWMTHAAEEPLGTAPKISEGYAEGNKYYNSRTKRPNLTAITAPGSTNAVDLVSGLPDKEDLDKMVQGLKDWNPERSPRTLLGNTERLTRLRAQDLIRTLPDTQKIDEAIKTGKHKPVFAAHTSPADWMKDARIIFNDPKIVKDSGFDAFRYWDVGDKAWAFPDLTKLETPWGTKLGFKSMGDFSNEAKMFDRLKNEVPAANFKNLKDSLKYEIKKGLYGPTENKIFTGWTPSVNKVEVTGPTKGYDRYVKEENKLKKYLEPKINRQLINADEISHYIHDKPFHELEHGQKMEISNFMVGKSKIHENDLAGLVKGVKDYKDLGANDLAYQKFGKPYNLLNNSEKMSIVDSMGGNKNAIIDAIPVGPDWKHHAFGTGLSGSELESFSKTNATIDDISKYTYSKPYTELDAQGKSHIKNITDSMEKAKSEHAFTTSSYKSGSKDPIEKLNNKNYGITTYQVTQEDLDHFVGKTLDQISENYFGKEYQKLKPGEYNFVTDVYAESKKLFDKKKTKLPEQSLGDFMKPSSTNKK